MLAKGFVIFLLVRLSFETDWGCPAGPKQPQLSTTFLDGFWYEVYNMNDYLNSEPCSHFHITCYESTLCDVELAIWDSYMLIQIYNGTIAQEVDKAYLTINVNSTLTTETEINIEFSGSSVLIWRCNDTITDSFASLLMRMETQEDMENVWEQAEHQIIYPPLLKNFPAGVWRKSNITQCINAAKESKTFFNTFLVASLIVIINYFNM